MSKKRTRKPTALIIGGGISGLSCGIYLLENGFDVTIAEKNPVCGGECVAWVRQKAIIDGCAHWIVGTNRKSQFYSMWNHVGAFDTNSVIHETEYFKKIDVGGEIVTLYSDVEKLKAELLRVAPEDKSMVLEFISAVKAYRHLRIPVAKPLDKMNVFELAAFGVHFLPMLFPYLKFKSITLTDYAKSFRSPILQSVFVRIITPDYNVHSLLYIMANLSLNDAGMVEGGSMKFSNNIRKHFLSLGGTVLTNKEAKEILIQDGKAIGALFQNDERLEADYVVAACDAHHILVDLLKGQYAYPFLDKKFANKKDNPLNACMQCSFKTSRDISAMPKMIDFPVEYPLQVGNKNIMELSIRNHAFDKTLNRGCTTMTVLLETHDDIYDAYRAMSKEEYAAEKKRIADAVKKEVCRYCGFADDELTFLDLTTPLTYERYVNSYRGSYMSFITTDKQRGLISTGLIKGLDNFVMSGQWIMPPGGLPTALLMGKHAAYRIAKWEYGKFVNIDKVVKAKIEKLFKAALKKKRA